MGDQTVTMDEEATALKKVELLGSIFAPPAGYKVGKTVTRRSGNSPPAQTIADRAVTGTETAGSLPLPAAGLVSQSTLGSKNPGMIRVGISKPNITTPESKKDPNAGADIAGAVAQALVASLKAEKVEVILLESDLAETECKQKECDY